MTPDSTMAKQLAGGVGARVTRARLELEIRGWGWFVRRRRGDCPLVTFFWALHFSALNTMRQRDFNGPTLPKELRDKLGGGKFLQTLLQLLFC